MNKASLQGVLEHHTIMGVPSLNDRRGDKCHWLICVTLTIMQTILQYSVQLFHDPFRRI